MRVVLTEVLVSKFRVARASGKFPCFNVQRQLRLEKTTGKPDELPLMIICITN